MNVLEAITDGVLSSGNVNLFPIIILGLAKNLIRDTMSELKYMFFPNKFA